jgi:hypothetical protein
MPELLCTREGVILHVAPPGIHWTADRGATWTKLNCPGTGYYPHSVQIEDGKILVASHIGLTDDRQVALALLDTGRPERRERIVPHRRFGSFCAGV